MLEESDGFMHPRSVVLDELIVSAWVLKFHYNYLHASIIREMCWPIGEVLQFKLNFPEAMLSLPVYA